jgi:signal transduction histidine kinase
MFILVVVFLGCLLAWWNIFTRRMTNELWEAREANLDYRRQAAESEFAGQDLLNPDVRDRLFQSYPSLEIEDSAGGPRIVVRQDTLSYYKDQQIRKNRMVLYESSTSFLLMLSGLFVIYMTLQREKALIRQQDVFIAASSHDLNTPLAGIRLIAETLQRKRGEDEDLQRQLDKMLREINRQQVLIDNLQAARWAASPKLDLSLHGVELGLDAERSADRLQSLFEGRGITLERKLEHVRIRADHRAVGNIIDNLLENAAKYSSENGHVVLETFVKDRSGCLRVSDNGAGIDRNEIKRIFNKFERGESAVHGAVSGTGLGLFLVKTFVRAQGGWVKAESDGPGRGSVFTVGFPLDQKEVKPQ